jgi:FkbM family methyltransferase
MLGRSSSQVSIFLRSIKPGDIVFDVGANIGEFTILLSHAVGSTGKVYAFEPVPRTFEILSRNVNRSRIANRVILNRCAVSDHLGHATIHMPASDHTEASLTDHSFASWSSKSVTSFECALETLDNYTATHSIQRVDFVKIDVEGAEMLVLNGMQNILRESPPLLMLEAFSPWMKDFGFTINDMFTLLSKNGYAIYSISKDELIPCNSPEDMVSLARFPQYVDFLCSVPGIHREQMACLNRLLG